MRPEMYRNAAVRAYSAAFRDRDVLFARIEEEEALPAPTQSAVPVAASKRSTATRR